jgi:hypothetical protein
MRNILYFHGSENNLNFLSLLILFLLSALDLFQFKLKSVSFLPKLDDATAYAQMPYEEIEEKKYLKLSSNIKPLDFSIMLSTDSQSEMYCESDVCMIL